MILWLDRTIVGLSLVLTVLLAFALAGGKWG